MQGWLWPKVGLNLGKCWDVSRGGLILVIIYLLIYFIYYFSLTIPYANVLLGGVLVLVQG